MTHEGATTALAEGMCLVASPAGRMIHLQYSSSHDLLAQNSPVVSFKKNYLFNKDDIKIAPDFSIHLTKSSPIQSPHSSQ